MFISNIYIKYYICFEAAVIPEVQTNSIVIFEMDWSEEGTITLTSLFIL